MDLPGHHEAGVEADAELADQVHLAGGLALFQPLQVVQGAGVGDGADVLHQLLAGHAHAVVLDHQRVVLLVDGDGDLQLLVPALEVGHGQELELHLVQGVGGVGHQLAQEHLLVFIERVDQDVEQLLDLRLKFECLFFFLGHFCFSFIHAWHKLYHCCQESRLPVARGAGMVEKKWPFL